MTSTESDDGKDMSCTEDSRRTRLPVARADQPRHRDLTGRYVTGDGGDLERFRGLVAVDLHSGCWLWGGRVTKDRYPLFDLHTGDRWRPVRAHRWSWEHQFELWDPSEWVVDDRWTRTSTGLRIPTTWTLDHLCHTFSITCPGGVACRHTLCVRPTHLEPLTPGGNVDRRHARDRALAAIRKGPR